MRLNLYIHHDVVTNHVMTRGINLLANDFDSKFIPSNIILGSLDMGLGRIDSNTNFQIVRGKQEVLEFFDKCHRDGLKIPNWIDFDSMNMMHELTPNEIAEILYLFHTHQTLRSAFFYKLQNNYVYLTLSNGLLKTYYRQFKHFYPRFQRVLQEQMTGILNESRTLFFGKKAEAGPFPEEVVTQLAGLFMRGVKVDMTQAYRDGQEWIIPLFIIEDELTLLTFNQPKRDQESFLIYNLDDQGWQYVSSSSK